MRRAIAITLLGLCSLGACASAQVLSPEQHLGRPLGSDFFLPDWDSVSSWFRALGEASPRVLTQEVGRTTEGRDFLLSVISSERNLARLDAIRAAARLLADPRGASEEELRRAVEEEPVVLFISSAMHATECAAPQFAMQLAYELATNEAEEWRAARERVVVLLAPSLNPDGLDHVAEWAMRHVGGPYEGTDLLKLYQLYAGHDNNRDWFMLSQAETRIVTELLYKTWWPQVYWDVHQQGSNRERMFVPPFRDPLNPNLDPAIVAAIDQLGTRALFDMTREGLTGVSTGVTYDMWWNGGNRNVPVRHNIVGLLTETASANLASPVFLPLERLAGPGELESYAPSNRFPAPWPGGWWRIGDILRYEMAFARSLLASLAREPELWRRNALEAARRALLERGSEAPRAWILPSDARDRAAVRRLVDVLLRTGVELEVADEPLVADGREWPAGSLVLRRRQPYGAHLKDLFEVQRYPAGPPPYDVSGWTLPYLLGVHRVEVMEELAAPLRAVHGLDEALAAFAGDPRVAGRQDLLSLRDSDAWPAIFRLLREGATLELGTRADAEGGSQAGLVSAAEGAFADPIRLRGLPRVGLYSPWRGSMSEGWMRWLLDHFELPYVTVRNESLRAGELGRFLDVLVLPSVPARELDEGRAPGSVPPEYAGGLAPEGAIAIEEFVRTGGTLVAIESSSSWAVELFRLPLIDVTRGKEGEGFSAPGSVLRAIPEEVPLCADLPPSLAIFFARSAAWRPMEEKERAEAKLEARVTQVLLCYAPTRVLLSGYATGEEKIAGRAAWVRAQHGAGELHLFGFSPHYRSWSQASFALLFRALLSAARVER